MKTLAFALAYAASLAVPSVLYLIPLGGFTGAYSVSVVLGLAAFTIFANQFLLASRPAFLVSALGQKRLLTLHQTLPAVGLAAAVAHRTVKGMVGMDLESPQAALGGIALLVFFLAVLAAAFLMANTFWMRAGALKAARTAFQAKTGLTYKRMRAVHNVTVAAVVLVLVHALLASSSDFAVNPTGAAWLVFWLVLCLGSYARYRVSGRKSKPGSPAA
jgi:predicted ferric reductase